jgi:hypothetical protein
MPDRYDEDDSRAYCVIVVAHSLEMAWGDLFRFFPDYHDLGCLEDLDDDYNLKKLHGRS